MMVPLPRCKRRVKSGHKDDDLSLYMQNLRCLQGIKGERAFINLPI